MTPGNTTSTSTSCAEVDTTVTTPVTQPVDTFSTELRARIGNGAFLYDQTFNVAFSDPQVQAAINLAHRECLGTPAQSRWPLRILYRGGRRRFSAASLHERVVSE